MIAADAARALAALHGSPLPPGGPRLVDYAERSRIGDWSLRSALVRFGQPEPVRASAVLELVRRTDAALREHARTLSRDQVASVPDLDRTSFTTRGGATTVVPAGGLAADARVVDLARVTARWPEAADELVGAYRSLVAVDDAQVAVIPLLVVAVELDDLADVLAGWAIHAGPSRPVDVVDRVAASAFARLAALDVPRERAPRRSGT